MSMQNIPKLINSGRFRRIIRIGFLIMLLLALLVHLLIFFLFGYIGKDSILFIFKAVEPPVKHEETMNFVTVDEKLLDEKIEDKEIKAVGRVNRQSRDNLVDPKLPKLGPSNQEESQIESFTKGNPLPDSIESPEITPTPPPVPKITAQAPSKPTISRSPAKELQAEPKPKEQVLPELPDLALQDNIKSILPKASKPKEPKKVEEYDTTEVPGITASDEISKITEKPIPDPITPATAPPEPQRPAQQEVKPQQQVVSRKIPVRKIGSTNNTNGSKMKKRLNSSAINTGSKSIAVLRSRYGAYMDKILRRIHQAIIIQQQINPISLHEGNVIMSFTINPQGYLDDINFMESMPNNIATEISAARNVLMDVHNGEPFEPPTPQMLNDPIFQKIVINFVFENR